MSLLLSTKKPKEIKPKEKKTADLIEYQREYQRKYREKNIEHLRNLERVSYYKKKYNLDQEFIGLFGEYSGDVFKVIKDFNELTQKCPELAPHIIARLKTDLPPTS